MHRFLIVTIICLVYSWHGHATNLGDDFEQGLEYKRKALMLLPSPPFQENETDPDLIKQLFRNISALPNERKEQFKSHLSQSIKAFHQFTVQHKQDPRGYYECGVISCFAGDLTYADYYLSRLRICDKPDLTAKLDTLRNIRHSLNTGTTPKQELEDRILNQLSWTAGILVSTWGTELFFEMVKESGHCLLPTPWEDDFRDGVDSLHPHFQSFIVLLTTKWLFKPILKFSLASCRRLNFSQYRLTASKITS